MKKELMDFLNSRNARIPERDFLHDPEKKARLLQFRRDTLLPRLERQRKNFLDLNFKPNATWWDSQPISQD